MTTGVENDEDYELGRQDLGLRVDINLSPVSSLTLVVQGDEGLRTSLVGRDGPVINEKEESLHGGGFVGKDVKVCGK